MDTPKARTKCDECWQEVSDILLNEVVVIGLECDEIRRKIKQIEKFLNKRWGEIRDAKSTDSKAA